MLEGMNGLEGRLTVDIAVFGSFAIYKRRYLCSIRMELSW